MKKVITLLLITVLVFGVLVACGQKEEEPAATVTPEATQSPEATEATAKTGLAVITSLEKSKAPAGADAGLAQTDSLVVAVLVGEDGKILACSIDAAQTKINFSAEGKILTDKATVFKSKQDLGTEYGMGKVSSIGKEWNEQANAFAAYVVGKTVDEVKGIALDEEGVPTEEDLKSSVTIKLGNFVAAVEKAVTNAKDLGAKSTDKLGIAVTTEISKSKDATADEAGLAQAYSSYAVVTTNTDGKITSCYLDGSQGNVNFDAKGVISTDLTTAPKTKQELGYDYGMKKASGIGKEWFEQADAFAEYVKGKSAAEVKGIAVDEEGKAKDADLISSVTVRVGSLIALVEKAATNAK